MREDYKFNVKTGQYTSHNNYADAFFMKQTAGTVDDLLSNVTWVYGVSFGQYSRYNDRGTGAIYSSRASQNIPSLYWRIKRLEYRRETSPVENRALNVSATDPLVLTYPNQISIEVGKRTSIKYQILEPYITVPTLPNIKFSIGKLMYRGFQTYFTVKTEEAKNEIGYSRAATATSNNNRFRFNERWAERLSIYEAQPLIAPLRATFLPHSNIPTSQVGDPCLLLPPLNEWKSPTVAQLTQLANYINVNKGSTSNHVQAIGGSHIVFPSTGAFSTRLPNMTHNKLILERLGYATYTLGNPIADSYTSQGYNANASLESIGYYWSNTAGTYLKISGLGSNLTASIETLPITATSPETTMFIRCVRSQ